jgi:HAD superfamily hydrolase (TIGR01490 family)
MRLALFDLDNTLLSGDSDYEWGQFLVDHGVLERQSYEAQNRAYYEQYLAGSLDIHEYLGFALRPLAAHAPADLQRWHAEFMRLRILPMITPAARALVRRHLTAGELCAIITATNSFVTAPIARAFEVKHLIATEPEIRDGRFTGRVAGTPCLAIISAISRRPRSTATPTTICRCSRASRVLWRSIPTKRSPPSRRGADGR